MISVILPTYNEAGNIKELIKRTVKVLKKDFEIIVVDDNSPDGTAEVVRMIQKRRPFLHLVVRRNERCLPSAIERGVKEAKGEIISWLDADLSMPPEKLPEMIKLLRTHDIVIGSTFLKGGQDARRVVHARFFSWLINFLCRLLLGRELTDYTSGFIVTSKKALKGTRFAGRHGTYFIGLLALAKEKGLRIVEVPYTFSPRHSGQSKISGFWSYLKTSLIYLKVLFGVRFGKSLPLSLK